MTARLGRAYGRVALAVALAALAACGRSTPPTVRVTASTGTSTATATRFEITEVQDSTFTIAVREFPWVAAGMTGIVVDPAKRDVLVARFRVLRRGAVDATALVTGQTTRVTVDQAALLEAPPQKPRTRRAFLTGWGLGFLLGSVVGALVGVSTR
jgi:hypothetical protein